MISSIGVRGAKDCGVRSDLDMAIDGTVLRRRAGIDLEDLLETLTEPEPLDFARGALGEIGDEIDVAGCFEATQLAFTELEELLLVGLCARLEGDERDDILAEVMIGDAQRRGFQDRGMTHQNIVDLPGGDVHPSFDDQFLGPADDEHIAILVDVSQVAGAQPSVGTEYRGSPLRILVIAGHDARPAKMDFARSLPARPPSPRG